MSKFEGYADNKIAVLPISKELSMVDKTNLLVSSDCNSFYPSAMGHPDRRWLK